MIEINELKNNKICVVGLGYVGLPLVHAFARKFDVVGFDISGERIDELKNNFDKTLELSEVQLKEVENRVIYTHNMAEIATCNIFIITVPTPIDRANQPDLTPLIRASETVGKVLKQDDIVIYESTVYPGVTEEICVPVLEQISNLSFNQDFYCGYSPERINPGDKNRTITKILKITSGSTPEVATLVDALYASIITAGTHKASSIKVAEAAKVIENTQRDVNIGLINELALIFDNLDIDTNDVIEAAATKWNFIKLTPGLVGGHCIGVDPYYLTHKAEEMGYKPNLILGARQINNGMSKYIAEKTIKQMIQAGKTIKGSRVLIMGLTFKENCPDVRNTKVVDIINELQDYGCYIEVYEPWIVEEDKSQFEVKFVQNPVQNNEKYDAIVVAVGHNEFKELSQTDYEGLLLSQNEDEKVIIDVKSIVPKPTWRL